MHTNWLQRIRQNEAMAKRLEREIPTVLGDPAITFDHAKRMIEAIDQHSAEVERLMDALETAGVTDDVIDAAERMEERWNALRGSIQERLIDIQRRRDAHDDKIH
ncbi:hypothetical protein IOD40_05820 [Aquamicrobium sp. cd-1]|uniref:Uncharacterized protein n=2 Tax=Aquamicrobium zhengzhouense TaxID=2781738 RepID=A0ABS0SA70_9HYPH|nr:hypothetical protein [Aquamicrobium zhengzhouense]